MSGEPQHSGLTRRRRRLSEDEVAERMLATAVDMVNATGLTVSLEHISFEDVIRAAGVARSAVYRRWPYKDLFFSALLRELSKASGPAVTGDDPVVRAGSRRIILDRLDWLREPATRRALAVELIREGALRELRGFHDSPEWRTYIALQATFLGLPDGDLRSEVLASLTRSERDLTARLAGVYREFAGLTGCRLRPGTGVTVEDLARMTSAAMRGMVIMAPSSPELVERTVEANPFGAPEAASWSQPALAIAGIITAFVEADPGEVFDDERVAAVGQALTQEG